MRRLWGLLGVWSLTLLIGTAQEEQPLINYAAGYGSFDYDFYVGDPNLGLVRDGRAEGFSVSAPSGFIFELDEDEKIGGLASQKITFNRNASSAAEARMSYTMYFPSNDYPQVGETVRIRLWFKAQNWNNATFRVRAYGINGASTTTLFSSADPSSSWAQLDLNYVTPNSDPAGIVVELAVIANAGISSGTIWLDELVVTGSKRWTPRPPRSFKLHGPYYPWNEESQRDWIFYAREFDTIHANWPETKKLRAYRPDLKNITYYNLIYSTYTTTGNWSLRDLFGYLYCDSRHPDWFLLNLSNQRQRFGSNLYLMDIGNPQASAWAANNLSLYLRYVDPAQDIVHFDSFIDFFSSGFHLQRYPTPASRIAAMTKHLSNMRAVTQDRGVQFIVNAASAAYTRDQIPTHFLRRGLIDGMLMEQVFTRIFSLPPGFLSFNEWLRQVNTIVENAPRIRILYSGYAWTNPVEGRRQKIYAMGSYLICADENVYLYLYKHYYDGSPLGERSWRPDDDFYVPLGQPTGAHEVFFRSSDYAGGLYYRPFQNGFVLVNPTGNADPLWKDGAVFTWILDADYWELWSGQTFPAGTRVKIYPKQARIFVRANSAALRDYPPAKGKVQPLPSSGGQTGKAPSASIPRQR